MNTLCPPFQPLYRLLFAVAFPLAWTGQASAEGEVDPKPVIRDIRAAWFSVAESLEPVRYQYTMQLSRAEGTGSLVLASERAFDRVESPDGYWYESRDFTHESGERKFREHQVSIGNDHYSGQVVDKKNDGQFLMPNTPRMRDGKKWREVWDAEYRLYTRLPWLTPELSFRVPDLIDPKLSEITTTDLGDGRVRVTFRARQDLAPSELEKFRGFTSGTLELNRNHLYRLESAELNAPSSAAVVSFRFTYETPPRHEYLLKRVESETKWTRPDQVPMTGRAVWEYECQHEGVEADPRQFYMSHYGLPEPMGVTPPTRPTPVYVWLLAAAGGFALIAVVCRWLMRRRTRAIPPPAVA